MPKNCTVWDRALTKLFGSLGNLILCILDLLLKGIGSGLKLVLGSILGEILDGILKLLDTTVKSGNVTLDEVISCFVG